MQELLNELKTQEKQNEMEMPIEGSDESGAVSVMSNVSKNKKKLQKNKISESESLHARDRAINKMAENDASIDFECNDQTRTITIRYFNVNTCIINFYVWFLFFCFSHTFFLLFLCVFCLFFSLSFFWILLFG